MRFSKGKNILFLFTTIATLGAGLWYSTLPKAVQIDWPKTITLLVGITLGVGVIWALLSSGYNDGPVAQILLKPRLNVLQTAALAYAVALVTSIGFGSTIANLPRAVANDSGTKKESTGNGCPIDSTKAKFKDTCEAFLNFSDRSTLREVRAEKNNETCRCIALNFKIEKMPKSNCEFSYDAVMEIMQVDSVRLRCL